MKLFSPNPPGLSLTSVEVDLLTGAMLVVLAASFVSVVVNAILGVNGFWGLSQNDLLWISGATLALMTVSRSFIAAMQNAGVASNAGFLTKVDVGLSSILSVVVAGIYWISSAWSGIAGNISALGVSDGTTAKVGALIAIALVIGQGLQKALQNWGFAKTQ